MAKLPRDIQVPAEQYIATTADTVESLDFLLDNIGLRDVAVLDLSPNSVAWHEQTVKRIHEGSIPPDAFPDLLNLYAFLLAQYSALVILHNAPAEWGIDAVRSSYFFGEPFVDADPSEGWQRFYPLSVQRGLESESLLTNEFSRSIAEAVSSCIEARTSFETLKVEIKTCIKNAPTGVDEGDIVRILQEKGVAPDPGAFAGASRRFPKRVGKVLRTSREFSKNRATKLWQSRKVPPNKSLERTREG